MRSSDRRRCSELVFSPLRFAQTCFTKHRCNSRVIFTPSSHRGFCTACCLGGPVRRKTKDRFRPLSNLCNRLIKAVASWMRACVAVKPLAVSLDRLSPFWQQTPCVRIAGSCASRAALCRTDWPIDEELALSETVTARRTHLAPGRYSNRQSYSSSSLHRVYRDLSLIISLMAS